MVWVSFFLPARRLVALVSILAFVSVLFQIEGLLGNAGILPVSEYLKKAHEVLGEQSFWQLPTLFWLFPEEPPLVTLTLVGIFGSVLAGVNQVWLARIGFFLALLSYLSISSVGQVFFGYQWDSLLTESLFLCIFFPTGCTGNRLQKIWYWLWHLCLRLILIKLLIGSAWVKWASLDPTWRDLTAMNYHYLTQPLPHSLSLLAHHLPESLHKASVIWVFAIEGIFPLMLFGFGYTLATGIFFQLLLQILILLTGSYGFFNLLTMALVLNCWHFDKSNKVSIPNYPKLIWIPILVLILHALISLELFSQQIWKNSFAPLQTIRQWIAPYRILNTYGLFATMTTQRLEISVEVSADCQNFTPISFNYKPDPHNPVTPHWAGFHMPRLDWQMWFAALGPPAQSPWFFRFLEKLASGSTPVKELLANVPNQPITCIRTPVYDTGVKEGQFTFDYLGVFTNTLEKR